VQQLFLLKCFVFVSKGFLIMSKSNRSNRANRESQVVAANEVGSIILAVQSEASDVPNPDNWDFAETSSEVETAAVETPVVEEAVAEVEAPAAPVEEVIAPVTASSIEFLPGLTPAIASAALAPPAPEKKERKKRKMGRPFYAAKVLRENGGLTANLESLVPKVNEECGKPNSTESLAWLKIAVQICSGWEEAKK
jgi:hypothetical protein